MRGKIIKGIAGFYYVHVPEEGLYECKAKGIFRNRNIKPLPGDNVEIEIISGIEMTGNITVIHGRRNALIRPAAANVDQALLVFAAAEPEPNLNLLDRFLLMMEKQGIPVLLCINKTDIAAVGQTAEWAGIYRACGYPVYLLSVLCDEGTGQVRELLSGKTTVLAGPSGVGKSSLVNLLVPEAAMETGSVSVKIKRGKHTTRHTELFCLDDRTYLLDTPGFSTLYLNEMEKEELKGYFPEFAEFEPECRFQGCVHIGERDCGIKRALEVGKIAGSRYNNYVAFYDELKNLKRY